jgi:DNA-binding NarL/FixJ family response regulator
MKQKILMIDDDPYAIQGVTVLLCEQYDVVGIHTAAEMGKMLKKHKFALVILDLDLKKAGHGLDLIETIKQHGCKVLVLTNAFDQESIFGCLRAEVNGFVPKQDKTTELMSKVQGAIAGHYMTDPTLIAALTRDENRLPKLGWRERELVDWAFFAPTLTCAYYAEQMHLSEGWVNNMFSKLFVKVNVHNRQQLLAELKRRGYRGRVPKPAEEVATAD